jgi:hypothetical protein
MSFVYLYYNNYLAFQEIEKQLGTGRSKEEIILHFLQLPLKNVSSIHLLNENVDETNDGRMPVEVLADQEPNVFSDYSNPLLQHVAIFKSLLEKSKKKAKEENMVEKNISKQLKFEIENGKELGKFI